jgi:hypothetical protein
VNFEMNFDGTRFRVAVEHGRQTACEPLCSNCGKVLERQAVAGVNSLLVCTALAQGCITPAREFSSEDEMNRFLEDASRAGDKAIEKIGL